MLLIGIRFIMIFSRKVARYPRREGALIGEYLIDSPPYPLDTPTMSP